VLYLHYREIYKSRGGGDSIGVRRLKRTVFPAKNVVEGDGGGGEVPINCSSPIYRSLPGEETGPAHDNAAAFTYCTLGNVENWR
jgi:hypothetical protein